MRSICSALVLCLLAGCETFVEYDPAPDPRLNLDAGCSPEDGFRGFLSVVKRLGDLQQLPPAGVTARWTAPDGRELNAIEPGRPPEAPLLSLRVPGPLAPGQTYRLDVRAPGFPDVTAQCSLPLPAPDFQVDVLGPAGPDGRFPLRVRFRDLPGPQAYWLRFYAAADTLRYGLRYGSGHPAITEASFWTAVQQGSTSSTNVIGIMRDVLFDGEEFSTTVRLDTTVRWEGPQRAYDFRAELLTMPRESYTFLATSFGQIPQTPFGDPVSVPSNVSGGAGFVQVQVSQSVAVDL